MTDGLFTETHERGRVRDEVSSRAWLRAMLDAEAALAISCAEAGLFPTPTAELIAAACADSHAYDDARLGHLAAQTGNPVVGLVAAIREHVPAEYAEYVHYGVTSQDIVDTAAMLVAYRAIAILHVEFEGCATTAYELAEQHRDTPMVARTLLQQAVPTTFGLKAAVWLHGIQSVEARLRNVQTTLPVQLGGAAGTLEGYPNLETAEQVTNRFASHLGLVVAPMPWHTLRYPIGDLAGGLATAAGVLGKIALDLILLAQNEVGEVSMAADGRGASSTMAHKRNPVAAIAARTAAIRVPGLTATLFQTMEQEHERAAGAWQAEWPTLSETLTCVGAAAAWLRDALASVTLDENRMAAKLATLESPASTGSAGALVDRALALHRRDSDPAE